MTRVESIKVLVSLRTFCVINGYHERTWKALDMAIEVLKADPCDDCVRREAVLKALADMETFG